MKIVFLDTATVKDLPQELAKFSKLGEYTGYERTAPEELVERMLGAEVCITNKVVISAAAMDALPHLKLICIAATGMNNVDLDAAAERGIQVRNISGYSTHSVAQHTLTSLLTLAMDLRHLNDAVYDGTYAESGLFSYWRRPFYELRGKVYGIVGLGTIGKAVGKLAQAYGAKVIYHSTSGRNTEGRKYPHYSLAELLELSDVVSVHCPLNEQTRGLLGYEELTRMKPSAYLVNVARGGIVVEPDLVRALNDGRLAGAVIDVFTTEPLPRDHPYMSVRNRSRLLLTPHIAWASVEARTELLAGIRENIRRGW